MAEQYIITVEFLLHSDEKMDKFFEYVSKNAKDSLQTEPGCLRFDVLIPKDSSRTVFLYEIYKDQTAFKNHLNAEHYRIFDSSVRNLVALKTVRQFISTKDLT